MDNGHHAVPQFVPLKEAPTDHAAEPRADSAPAALRYRFADCLLDLKRRALVVGGVDVSLQPRSFDLLAFLVSRAGRAFGKDELIAAVWPTPQVTDAVLTTAVAKVRRAIGDTDAQAPMLRTLHGVGYRFDARVQAEPVERPSVPQPALASAALAPEALPSDEGFWREQLERARRLARQGMSQPALELLGHAEAAGTTGPESLQLRAQLLRHRRQLDASAALLAQALAAAPEHLPGTRRVALLLEASRVQHLQRQVTAAVASCEEAVDLMARGEADPCALPAALAQQANLLVDLGAAERMAQLCERVEELNATRPDPQAMGLVGLVRARLALNEGRYEDALAQARQALETAQAVGAVRLQSDALTLLSYLLQLGLKLQQAAEFGRRAAIVATDHGDLTRRDRGRARELLAMLYAGRLDETQALIDRCEGPATADGSPVAMYNFTMIRALLEWRQGQHRVAMARLEALAASAEAWGLGRRNDLLRKHAWWSLAFGDAAPARLVLQTPAPSAADAVTLEAALALHDGDRARAKRVLRAAWAAHRAADPRGWEHARSLAWLQVEDEDRGGLDALLEAVAAMPREEPSVGLLLQAAALRLSQARFDARRWAQALRANAGLVHRHAWLLQPDGARDWLDGRRRLSELLVQACD